MTTWRQTAVGIVSILAAAGLAMGAAWGMTSPTGVATAAAPVNSAPPDRSAATAATPGALTWKISTSFLHSQISHFTAISCPSVTTCYAVGPGPYGGYVTTDAGNTWSALAQQPSVDGSYTIACPSVTVCYTGWGVTTDSGRTWRGWNGIPPVGSGGGPSGGPISCPSTTTCYMVNATGIYVTTDSGTTWHLGAMPSGAEGWQYAVACPSTTACYAIGYDSSYNADILATTDSGQSWTFQTRPPDLLQFTAISCPSVTMCSVVGTDFSPPGTEMAIAVTTGDSGTTWTTHRLATLYGGPTGISCPSITTCYTSVAGAGVVYTNDTWATWHRQEEPSGFRGLASVACPASSSCYAVGVAGRPRFGWILKGTLP